MIERIAGDGVIAVFSPFFGWDSATQAEANAVEAARAIVECVAGTSFETKAALSSGPLLFCKTGVASVYEDFTVVGTPLTELHRLEDVAVAGQVVHRADTALGRRVLTEIQNQDHLRRIGLLPPFTGGWIVHLETVELRGVEEGHPVPIVRQSHQPHGASW
jgi:class 3 adenylate cyclase